MRILSYFEEIFLSNLKNYVHKSISLNEKQFFNNLKKTIIVPVIREHTFLECSLFVR
jgi:hypothetical protein